MVYVGVLASACKIEMEAVEAAIRREFPGRKAKAAEININAVRTGFEWAEANLPADLPFQVRTDRRCPGEDPDRGEQGGGAGRDVRRGERADLVSDHALQQPGGVRRGVPQEAPGRPGRQADLRHRAGGGRAGGRRHGHRRGLGRGAVADGHGRARDLADVRVRRAGLLRRDPRGDRRRPAHGAEHRPAHPDQPGRHPQAPPPGPRRQPPHRADPRLGRGVLLADHRGPRPGAAVPDAGVRRHRPRPGHEPLAQRPVPLPHQADPSRQGALGRGPGATGPVRAVQGRRRRRRLLSHDPRHRAPAGGLLHAGHRPQREVGIQRAARGLEEEPGPAGPQAGDGPPGPARAR